jgi:hypothetical protein
MLIVTVPEAITEGLGLHGMKPYTVYVVEVHLNAHTWKTKRRYSEFYDVHTKLSFYAKKIHAELPSIPSKYSFRTSNLDAEFVNKRRLSLQLYLQTLVLTLQAWGMEGKLPRYPPDELAEFLGGYDYKHLFAAEVSSTPNIQGRFPAIALYAYEAQSEGELTFKEGQKIIVLTKDSSGWWMGELNSVTGLFPSSYVQLESDSPEKPIRIHSIAVGEQTEALKNLRANITSSDKDSNKPTAKAIYDYTPDEENELRLKVGDVITINRHEDSWYLGTNQRGESGWFPANYVELQHKELSTSFSKTADLKEVAEEDRDPTAKNE